MSRTVAMTDYRHRPLTVAFALLSAAGGAAVLLFSASTTSATAPLTVTGVSINHSSAKVFYNPVAGASDYRIYDVTSPTNVKYAGMTHISPDPECPGTQCFRHFLTQADGLTPLFPYQASAWSYPNGGTGGPQVLDVPATEIDYNNLG